MPLGAGSWQTFDWGVLPHFFEPFASFEEPFGVAVGVGLEGAVGVVPQGP